MLELDKPTMPVVDENKKNPAKEVLHEFHLRSSYRPDVRLYLPEDLTDREAERLAIFIRSCVLK